MDETDVLWRRSNFSSLESYLRSSLTTGARIRSKLLGPLGAAEGMLAECAEVLTQRRKDLEGDAATVTLLESQTEGWVRDMERGGEDFRRAVRGVLGRDGEGGRCRVLTEGSSYAELWRWSISGGGDGDGDGDDDAFEARWKRARPNAPPGISVEAEIVQLIEEYASDLSSRAKEQGRAVVEYLGKRPAIVSRNVLGTVSAVSNYDDVRDSLGKRGTSAVEAALGDRCPDAERERVRSHLRATAFGSGAMLLGSIALGVGAGAGTSLMDPTIGVGGSLALATATVLGLIPYRRRGLIESHRRRWDGRSGTLDAALEDLCESAISRVRSRSDEGVAPYVRYVRTERERVSSSIEEVEDLSAEVHSLRRRIHKTVEC